MLLVTSTFYRYSGGVPKKGTIIQAVWLHQASHRKYPCRTSWTAALGNILLAWIVA